VAVRYGSEVEVDDPYMSDLVGTGAGVVQEQQYRIIPPTLEGMLVRRRQQSVHLLLRQVGDQAAGGLLEGHAHRIRDGVSSPS
jgi:hypothetical protein